MAAARDDVVTTTAGPVAVTATIGGVTAPRHAQNVDEILARAQEALDSAKGKRRGSFLAYRPNLEREARRRENVKSTDAIVAALNERRILLAYEPVVRTLTRAPAFYECLLRVQRADGTLSHAQEVIPIAERLGLVRHREGEDTSSARPTFGRATGLLRGTLFCSLFRSVFSLLRIGPLWSSGLVYIPIPAHDLIHSQQR